MSIFCSWSPWADSGYCGYCGYPIEGGIQLLDAIKCSDVKPGKRTTQGYFRVNPITRSAQAPMASGYCGYPIEGGIVSLDAIKCSDVKSGMRTTQGYLLIQSQGNFNEIYTYLRMYIVGQCKK
jgi:hypothetical protein